MLFVKQTSVVVFKQKVYKRNNFTKLVSLFRIAGGAARDGGGRGGVGGMLSMQIHTLQNTLINPCLLSYKIKTFFEK